MRIATAVFGSAPVRRFRGCVCLLALFAIIGPVPATPLHADDDELSAAQKEELPRHFGFAPLEIFKIEHGITQLRTADVNNDQATDILVANNAKSTIEVLLQRESEPEEREEPKDVNDLINPWRFEQTKVSITWQVACLQADDVTGDGNVDLVFTGNPKELVVLPGEGDGTFRDPITRRVRDLLAIPVSCDVADMNGDDRLDVLVLAESDVIIFFQPEDGGLGKPVRFAHALDSPLMLTTADLNGDSRADIVLLSNDDTYPVQVRCQNAAGELGPVERIKLPTLRALKFASCLGRTQDDLFGVERVSGRLKRWVMESNPAERSEEEWTVRYYPLPGKSDVERLPVAVGDVTGDGRADVVSANVDAAQLVLFAQKDGLGLGLPESFGGQIKMLDMSCVDTDGDGADELYVLSAEEETIARSTFEENRLTFPKAMPTLGRPYALAVSAEGIEGSPRLAYVTRNEDSDYELLIQPLDAEEVDDERIMRISLEDVEDPPNGMRWVDANRDGREDLIMFAPFGPLQTALQQEDGTFERLASTGRTQTGLVKDATGPGFEYADTDGDGHRDIVLAQKAFVRALRINEHGTWEILDQYNAPTSDADITGVCAVKLPDRDRPALAMFDRKAQAVHYYLPAEGGTYTREKSVPVGAFDLKAMRSAPLGGTDAPSILLAGNDRLALILPDQPANRMDERAVYESSIKNGRLRQIAVGDLNHDGRTDLAVTESNEHFVEILTFGPGEELVRATKFKVFAKKQYNSQDHEGTQPHWVVVDDVTRDEIDDLILICHDRILLYPGQ